MALACVPAPFDLVSVGVGEEDDDDDEADAEGRFVLATSGTDSSTVGASMSASGVAMVVRGEDQRRGRTKGDGKR